MAFATPFSYLAQTTTVRTVKTTPGSFKGYMVYNPNATVAYIQMFDTAGAVTLGTTAPTFVIPIPATSGANVLTDDGITLSQGLKLACTTTATGSTAPSTGLDLCVCCE
jgi:hypothetical protein